MSFFTSLRGRRIDRREIRRTKQSVDFTTDCFAAFDALRSSKAPRIDVIVKFIFALALVFILHSSSFILSARAQGNVGIGTTAPDASALLDLTSLSRGLLVPRLTEAQKWLVPSPATGLLIYETDNATIAPYAGQTPTFWYYNGTTWVPFLSGGWLLFGNSGTSASTNFIGTTDSVDWVIRTNNIEHMRVYAGGNVGLTNTNNKAEEFRFYEPSGSGSFYSGFKASTLTSASVTYKWPSADGNGTNYILCTDGSGNLSWRGFGTAGGGGVDVFWSRGYASFALIGHGFGCTDTGNFSITDGLNNAIDDGAAASVVWGENNIVAQGDSGCVISGGDFDTASAPFASMGAGTNNSAKAAYSSVVAGQNNSACGQYAVVVGGSSNIACGNYATILGGTGNTVSGNYSLAFGVGATVASDYNVVYYASGNTAATVGIGTTQPAEALDIVGNFRFSGALMPNGVAGNAGQVLRSAGAAAPTWVNYATGNFWTTWGNTGTISSVDFVGTGDGQPFVFKTYATERMRILSTGQVAINTTTTTHQLHSLYSGTTDETAAVFGQATGATSNQVVGIWGSAAANTGTIGVLATGNGNSTGGQTNVALQLNDGELAAGRTTEAPGAGSAVEGATAGTAYSAQGPSGVIELTLGAAGNLTTSAPTSGVFQNLGSITINNRYCSSTSIVIVNIVSKSDDGVTPDCEQAQYFADIDNRASGSFSLRVGMIPTTTSATNYTTSDKIRVGYVIINPGR